MATLKQRIQEDTKNALKSGDSFSLGVLRMVSSSVNAKEKEKRYKLTKENPEFKEEELVASSVLNDDEVTSVISSEIKKRKDAIALYQEGNRPELAENEEKEMVVLKKYLPEQLSPEVLRGLIEESIKTTGAKEMKEMGKIMADLMPKVKGKADNAEISKIVKELLA